MNIILNKRTSINTKSKKNTSAKINSNAKTKSSQDFEGMKLNSFVYKPKTILLTFIFFFLLAILEFMFNKDSLFFWLLTICVLPATAFLYFKKGLPLIPFLINIFQTKKGIKFINWVGQHGKILEKLSLIGFFFGYGLAGINYWLDNSKSPENKLDKKKNALEKKFFLLLATILLIIIYLILQQYLLSIPLLQNLFWPCLIGFVLLGLGGFSFAMIIAYGIISLVGVFSAHQMCPSIAPVIPGMNVPGLGVIIPTIGWVSLVLVMVIHELGHGIMFTHFKKKIESVGVILLGFIPIGAFVQQNKKQFDEMNPKEKILVLSAGPSSNLIGIIAGFFILFLVSLVIASPLGVNISNEFDKSYDGLRVAKVNEKVSYCGTDINAPAFGKILVGDKVLFLNDLNANKIADFTLAKKDLANGKDMNIVVDRNGLIKEFVLTPVVFADLNLRLIGLEVEAIPTNYQPGFFAQAFQLIISSIYTITLLFVVLCLAVALFNFMPCDILPGMSLDGSYIAKSVLTPYAMLLGFKGKDAELFTARFFLLLFWFALILNLIPYITMIFWK